MRTGLPAILYLEAVSSAAASLAPLTMSIPRAAEGPDNGWATPMVMLSGMRGPQAHSTQATNSTVAALPGNALKRVMWVSRERGCRTMHLDRATSKVARHGLYSRGAPGS